MVTEGYTDLETGAKERDRYIWSELKRLQAIADKQESLCKELLSRLVAVTNKESPSVNEAEKPTETLGVPLADDLTVVRRQVNRTNMTLEDILNRLEI